MYPYILLWGLKFYMTWIGIVVSFLVFLLIARYLTKKYHQNFWKLFYWLPLLILLTYFFGSYMNFILEYWFFPTNSTEFMTLLSPSGYRFHFVGVLLGIYTAISIFLKKIVRIENKKVWSDILFFSLVLSLVPLWIFLLMGDNFIWLSTSSWLGIKSLHSDSHWNKFTLVYPIGIFLSLWSLFISLFIKAIKNKKFGYGMLGFSLILLFIAGILIFQQYSRHVVFSFWSVMFDIKQYAAVLFAIIAYFTFRKRKKTSKLP